MNTYCYFVKGDCIALAQVQSPPQSSLPSASSSHFSLPTQANFSDTQLAAYQAAGTVFYEQDATHVVLDAQAHALPVGYELVSVRKIIAQWSKTQIHHAFKAIQIMRWRQEHGFCSRCGADTCLEPNARELAAVCPKCEYRQYPRLQPCVIVAITKTVQKNGINTQQILLAKDRRFTLPMMSVIAGYVEVGETLEQAVAREVKEETGLLVENLRYLGSQPWPYPSNIMIAFQADYAGGEISLDDDELEHADFYDANNLPTIPPKGSISHEMIMHICHGAVMDL